MTVYTYKVCARPWDDLYPLSLYRQVGTSLSGWLWARYEEPLWKRVCKLEDLHEVPAAIEDSLKMLIADERQRHLADNKRAALPEGGLTFTATVVLGDNPKTDTYTVTAN
ncbi:hypothetical protein [Aminobacter sp. HY435]|uniref:hypothetical protein n=1 Tax=Aminobacter sp. HY435 TaxID=2970917 RepID=UPI0022B96862|nr:hypothetical protein [Aminobacter sp. HY435]